MLKKNTERLSKIYIFAQEKNFGKQQNKDQIIDFIVNGKSQELKLLYEYKIIKIIRTNQLSVGIHFPQLGEEALKTLRSIKDQGGYFLR